MNRMTRFTPATGAAILTLLLAAMTPPAGAVTPVTTTGFDLEPRRVSLQGMDDRAIGLFDSSRKYTTQPLEEVLVITILDDTGAPAKIDRTMHKADAGVVELIDGQRLVGQMASTSEDGQTITWSSPLIPPATISLDRVSAVTLRGEPPAWEPATEDAVLLMNGDHMTGFVTGVMLGAINLQAAGQRDATPLPSERVRGVRFAGAAQRKSEGHRVTLCDGSVLTTSALSVSDDKLTLKPRVLGGEREVTLELSKVARIAVATPRGMLLDLRSIGVASRSGGEVFGVPTPAVFDPGVDPGVLRLHAPIGLTFNLPPGARRFTARAELDDKDIDPARLAAWADTSLVVRVDGKEVGRWRLRGGEPSASINILISGTTLALELDPGANGPVLDRVRLIGPAVLVELEKP